jgi:hypothetical protein
MPSYFRTEKAANDHKDKHHLFGRVAEFNAGRGKWMLNFPLQAHVTVIPHTQETRSTDSCAETA